MDHESFDLVIIGSGPGGYVAAIRAAQLGLKTACIEKNDTFGGTCLNVGCIPSKALLQSSGHYAFLQNHAKEHGIECQKSGLDFSAMMKRKDEVVNSLVSGVSGLLQRNKVKTFKGIGKFLSSCELQVSNGKNQQVVKAKNFILATGSESIELPFLKFDEKRVLSSTGALSLSAVPKKMLVIGAGVIGVELASVYARLGSEVTIIEMLEQICPAMDEAVSKMLLQILKKQGIIFHLGAQVTKALVLSNEVELLINTKEGEQTFKADVVLVSVGRRPYTIDLGLEKAEVKITPRGFVVVDGNFRTTQTHIYAIGDIIDGPMLAHRASEEGVAAVEIIAGQFPRINYMALPNVIYTHPEVAAVGFTEKEAQQAGIKCLIGTASLRGNARARCAGELDGMVKIIADSASKKIIGMHIISSSASEMIGEGVIAIEKCATIEELANAPHAHPTLSESIKEASLNALERAIHL